MSYYMFIPRAYKNSRKNNFNHIKNYIIYLPDANVSNWLFKFARCIATAAFFYIFLYNMKYKFDEDVINCARFWRFEFFLVGCCLIVTFCDCTQIDIIDIHLINVYLNRFLSLNSDCNLKFLYPICANIKPSLKRINVKKKIIIAEMKFNPNGIIFV